MESNTDSKQETGETKANPVPISETWLREIWEGCRRSLAERDQRELPPWEASTKADRVVFGELVAASGGEGVTDLLRDEGSTAARRGKRLNLFQLLHRAPRKPWAPGGFADRVATQRRPAPDRYAHLPDYTGRGALEA